MRRYLTDQSLYLNSIVTISEDTFRHIHKVCRQDVGDKFELLNEGSDEAFLAEVISVEKNHMQVRVINSRPLPDLKKPYIHLVLNFPKPQVFEDVIEKAVELGVHSLYPTLSDFSFFKTNEKIKDKVSRWDKIVKSAMQQTGRFKPLKIHPAQDLESFLKLPIDKDKKNLYLAFYEGQGVPLHQFLEADSMHLNEIENIWVFVGSEGGFSSKEVKRFQELNIPSLSLGEQVLRVETACVSIVSVLRYKSGLMG